MAQSARARLKDERLKLQNQDRQIEDLAAERATLLVSDFDQVERIDSEIIKQQGKRAARAELIALLEVEAARADRKAEERERQRIVSEIIEPGVAALVQEAGELEAAILGVIEKRRKYLEHRAELLDALPDGFSRLHDDLGHELLTARIFTAYTRRSADGLIADMNFHTRQLRLTVANSAERFLAWCRKAQPEELDAA